MFWVSGPNQLSGTEWSHSPAYKDGHFGSAIPVLVHNESLDFFLQSPSVESHILDRKPSPFDFKFAWRSERPPVVRPLTMDCGTLRKFLAWLRQLPNIFRSGSTQAGTKPAEWYLELTTECLEQTQQMISGHGSSKVELNHNQRRRSTKLPRLAEDKSTGGKLYKCQCEYLVEKLATAASNSRETYLNTAASSAQQSTYHEVLKLLYRLATNVHGFVHSCCKEGGMQLALTAASVPMYVCSLGFYLEVCTKLLHHSNSLGVATPTYIDLERLWGAEKIEVERRALFDKATLMHTINSLILHGESSSASVQLQLATIVQKRLKASQGTSTSGPSKVSYLEAWQVDGKSLLRLAELGTGSSAAVHKAKWFGVIEVAEKVFRVSRDGDFDRDMSLLAELSHPNIVSTLGYWEDERSCSVVTELMDGDLYCLMGILSPREVGMGPFSISVACDIMLQVAQGMAYIHDKGVVHRDLKSHNILFKRSQDDDIEYICVKVGDFGISRTKERSFLCTHQTSNTGSYISIAPELTELPGEEKKAQSSFHPYKSDVYSFGMLCFEILTGELPFSTINSTREVKKKVLAGIRPVLPPQCPQELKMLIESCWDSDPPKRPDFARICKALMKLYFSLLIGVLEGDLHDLICRNMHRMTLGGPFTNDDAIHVMLQIAEGMDYVHQTNVVHRDLKSYNILVRETNVEGKHLDIKVADFGLSKQMKPGNDLHFNVGTVSWMAPEVMRLKKNLKILLFLQRKGEYSFNVTKPREEVS